jgi:hypothetical protein
MEKKRTKPQRNKNRKNKRRPKPQPKPCPCPQPQPDPQPQQRRTMNIGNNLAGVTYYTSEWVFSDCFKQSMPLISQKPGVWNDGRTIQYDANGAVLLQPDQQAGTLIYREIDDHFPKGKYIMTYEGEGAFEFSFACKKVSEAPGRIELDTIPQSAGMFMRITKSNPSNPVKNIKIVHQDLQNAGTFHPLYVERLKGFSTIRFMDWGQTNNSKVATWSQRTSPIAWSQADSAGVAIEYMIELSNLLKANMWICIPHLADNNYVTECAKLIANKLDPKLKVYVEYSNECWNSIFSQTKYCNEKAVQLGLTTIQWEGWRYYSQRSVEVFNIFQGVFGGLSRMVRVLATQAANPWLGEQTLAYKEAYKNADAIAIAPYFSCDIKNEALPLTGPMVDDFVKNTNSIIAWTSEDIAALKAGQVTATFKKYGADIGEKRNVLDNHMRASGFKAAPTIVPALKKSIADKAGKMKSYVALGAKYNVDVIAYEGGQHLVGSGHGLENHEVLTTLFIETNRHPIMYDAYMEYFETWKQTTGADSLFCQFSNVFKPRKWGAWGILEWQDQNPADAPKYRAVLEQLKLEAIKQGVRAAVANL